MQLSEQSYLLEESEEGEYMREKLRDLIQSSQIDSVKLGIGLIGEHSLHFKDFAMREAVQKEFLIEQSYLLHEIKEILALPCLTWLSVDLLFFEKFTVEFYYNAFINSIDLLFKKSKVKKVNVASSNIVFFIDDYRAMYNELNFECSANGILYITKK